jgi:hypothetical protein
MKHASPISSEFLEQLGTKDIHEVSKDLRDRRNALNPNLTIVRIVGALATRPTDDFSQVMQADVLPIVIPDSPIAETVAEGLIQQWLDTNIQTIATGFEDPKRNEKKLPIGGAVFYMLSGEVKLLFSEMFSAAGSPGEDYEFAAWRGRPATMSYSPTSIHNSIKHLIENNKGAVWWAREGQGRISIDALMADSSRTLSKADKRMIARVNQVINIDEYIASILPRKIGSWSAWPISID